MVYIDGSYVSFLQVERDSPLYVSDYIDKIENDRDKIYLFTISENYGEKTHPQIICIGKLELEDFLEENMHILSKSMLDLIKW